MTVARLVSTTWLKCAVIPGLLRRSVLMNFMPWLTGAGLIDKFTFLPE
jgi:hypothetical protein